MAKPTLTTPRDADAARKTVTRAQAVAVSARLFSAHGYRATNLKLVADELGVTRQALYYHFSSKDEILGALFESLMSKLEIQALSEQPDVPNRPRYVSLLVGHAEVALAHPTLTALMMQDRPALDRIEWLGAAERRRDYAELFDAAHREGVSAGQLRPELLPGGSEALIAAVDTVCRWQQDAGRNSTADAESIIDGLAQGIVPDGKRSPGVGKRRRSVAAAAG